MYNFKRGVNMDFITTIIIIAPFALIFFLLINANRYNQLVYKHSKLLKQTIELNKDYTFNSDFNKHYRYDERVEYKAKLDQFDFESYLMYKAENNKQFFEDLIQKLDFNLELYKKYDSKNKAFLTHFNINNTKKYFINLKRLLKVEAKIVEKNKLKPMVDTEIEIIVRYTSPRGRNSYSSKATYRYYELKTFYQEMLDSVAMRSTRSYQMKVERIKMTASMRYQVLVRDKATCQICGASKKDGVILHVDHILPVAKGGKSTLDNLRTLCDRCNLGKKDRIEDPQSF
jgi:hypothetical protein